MAACTAFGVPSLRSTAQQPGARSSTRRRLVVIAKKAGGGPKQRGPLGFVEEDNSGRSNIFAVEPKMLYTSSPRSDRAARQGLGGLQGLGVLVGALAIVLLVTLGIAKNPQESLQVVAANAEATESLSKLASRMADSP